jgi:DNA-binding response OmpR family regulator
MSQGPTSPPGSRPAPGSLGRLLIVDDEPDVRSAMRRVLERAGYAVRVAGAAEQALEELRVESVELMITDMIMPKENGATLIASVKAEFPAVRILAISGGGNFWPQGYKREAITTSAYLAAASTAGADGVLAKPFEILELLEVIRSVLAGETSPPPA